jgi:acetyl-coenzyme A carboxylase carboxyl transferase subunit alpha 
MEAYKRVALPRKKSRPTGQDFIDNLFTDFIQLHGDRCFGDDPPMITGLGFLMDLPVTVIAQERGKNTKSRVKRNFGSSHPEGYRKALRQMKLAEKFNRPIVCLIDTSGAICGIGAEQRGQGHAIAKNLMEMMSLTVPILSIVIGERGSGGALALGVADEVWMLENAIYSVISPEGCATILWKGCLKSKEAAKCLKLTAQDLYELQLLIKLFLKHRDLKRLSRTEDRFI